MHTGEAIRDGGEFYGRSVIIATRVAGNEAGRDPRTWVLRQLVGFAWVRSERAF